VIKPGVTREILEELYSRFNTREYAHPDPVELLYQYEGVQDREIAAIIASSLAYGNVKQILKSVTSVLQVMGKSPYEFVRRSSNHDLEDAFIGFKHRFTDGHDLSLVLAGARSAIERHGSLNNCFLSGLHRSDETVIPGLSAFVAQLAGGPVSCTYLMPSPVGGSACKRLNLFLRWMVRADNVDPGGWEGVQASKLVVPLDTHMHRICMELGLTERKQANLRTALEITDGFKKFAPDDPVRYDFALTRLGIRTDVSLSDFLSKIDEKQ
jgi:uncharacterized protein (TIGR02757 family)